MSFSYLCKEQLDRMDLETFEDGNTIHIRKKSSQEGFDLKEEKRLFMELYEKHGIEIRAQFQHDGFWGTALRNDGRRFWDDYSVPQGVDDYEWNKKNGKEPSVDTWPRMYTEQWLADKN